MSGCDFPLVLVGLPGVGKTRVGHLLARDLGVPHLDTDDLVEEEAGCTISELFAHEGEDAFREREAAAVERALSMRAVISLGGGAVTTARVRELLREVTVIRIDADHDELMRRVTKKSHRPLLASDPEGTLKRLREERDPYYRSVASITFRSSREPATTLARHIGQWVRTPWRSVEITGARNYEVLIGQSIPVSTVRLALRPEASKTLIIHPQALTLSAKKLAEDLRQTGLEVTCAPHLNGEAAKTLEVVESMWDLLGTLKLGRADAIIALGGGATTDMAGFVAATWLRGIDCVCIPTTLLGMVDAAIGGKTGINTAAGKNLVGSFHPPVRVICDLTHLETLDKRELLCGMGEIIKCGFIEDETILSLVESSDRNALLNPASPLLAELVWRAIAVKARVVSADLEELGLREILNYGHTLAHAIERCENYRWRHGEAVAVGCVFAAHLGQSLGFLPNKDVERHVAAFKKVGLPTSYSGAHLDALVEVMLSDKKVRAGQLRFVLLEGIGHPTVHRIEASELVEPAKKVGIASD